MIKLSNMLNDAIFLYQDNARERAIQRQEEEKRKAEADYQYGLTVIQRLLESWGVEIDSSQVQRLSLSRVPMPCLQLHSGRHSAWVTAVEVDNKDYLCVYFSNVAPGHYPLQTPIVMEGGKPRAHRNPNWEVVENMEELGKVMTLEIHKRLPFGE